MKVGYRLVVSLLVAAACIQGCVREEEEEELEEEEAIGEAEQALPYALCQTDQWGYQTGVCLNDGGSCSIYPPGQCIPGVKLGAPTQYCGTWVNNNRCMPTAVD